MVRALACDLRDLSSSHQSFVAASLGCVAFPFLRDFFSPRWEIPQRNLELSKCLRCDAGLIWHWWGMRRLRNDKYLVNIVPMKIIIVAVQKHKLHYIRGKRRLFCVFQRCLCQHSNTAFTWLKSCFSVKVYLESEQWIATQQGLPPSISLSFWVSRVKSVPPLVFSFAATWVLCSGFEDGVRLMHHHHHYCYYCYCYYLFAPKASVVVGFLLSFELYSAAEFLDWMKAVWWGWQTGGKEPGEVWCGECVTK